MFLFCTFSLVEMDGTASLWSNSIVKVSSQCKKFIFLEQIVFEILNEFVNKTFL